MLQLAHMASSILIKGGSIVNADRTFVGDVLIVGDKIAAVGENLVAPSSARIIDALGK